MSIRKSTLWRVPVYCIVAGLIVSRLILPIFYPSTFAAQPDGSTARSLPRELILYGIIFAVTLFIGWLLFRRMTRRELFWSAAILVAFYLVINLLVQIFSSGSGPLWTVFLYTVYTREWSSFISLFFEWTLASFSTIFSLLAPFLFVLFGTGSLVKAAA